jgi:hypothetical protein
MNDKNLTLKFWIVDHYNTFKQRYVTLEDALAEAKRRIDVGEDEAVFILEPVKLVRRIPKPVEVIDV